MTHRVTTRPCALARRVHRPLIDMDAEDQAAVPFLKCYCGKVFSQQSALTNHTRACKPSNKRLSSVLSVAREKWEKRKRRKLDVDQNVLLSPEVVS